MVSTRIMTSSHKLSVHARTGRVSVKGSAALAVVAASNSAYLLAAGPVHISSSSSADVHAESSLLIRSGTGSVEVAASMDCGVSGVNCVGLRSADTIMADAGSFQATSQSAGMHFVSSAVDVSCGTSFAVFSLNSRVSALGMVGVRGSSRISMESASAGVLSTTARVRASSTRFEVNTGRDMARIAGNALFVLARRGSFKLVGNDISLRGTGHIGLAGIRGDISGRTVSATSTTATIGAYAGSVAA